MIGILVALAISWILLYLVEKKSILALGLFPISQRLQQFGIGFLMTAILCVCVQFFESILKSSKWVVNENINGKWVWDMFYWDLMSVLTEEFIFRGAILFILIKKLGVLKGILISAIAFGIYHWFSFGILGNIIPMFFVFIGTGLMGYAWALAFSKTESMAMPVGFHLGWNFTFNSIFSHGSLGNGIFLSENEKAISSWFSLIGLWLVPLLLLIFVKHFVSEKKIEFIK
jgi:uncharacterized protein